MQRVITFALAFILLLSPFVLVHAAELENPLGFNSITEFLQRILEFVVLIAFPFLVLFLVFIGFKFVAASGNPEELKKVRQMFFWAIVGALLILGAQALSLAIGETVEDLQQGIL